MGNSKGQAAIEYLAVFGLALALSTPFIINAQTSMMDLQTSSSALSLQNSLQKLETSINTVSASGEPAQRTFRFEVPSNVESAQLNENSVVYTINTRTGRSDLIRTFDSPLTGNLPQDTGTYSVTVYAEEDVTVVEVVE